MVPGRTPSNQKVIGALAQDGAAVGPAHLRSHGGCQCSAGSSNCPQASRTGNLPTQELRVWRSRRWTGPVPSPLTRVQGVLRTVGVAPRSEHVAAAAVAAPGADAVQERTADRLQQVRGRSAPGHRLPVPAPGAGGSFLGSEASSARDRSGASCQQGVGDGGDDRSPAFRVYAEPGGSQQIVRASFSACWPWSSATRRRHGPPGLQSGPRN